MKIKKYTTRTEENFEKLTKLMTDSPSTSQRTTTRRMCVSPITIQQKLSDLNLQPYKIQFTEPLNEDHKQKRLVFAQNMKQLMKDDDINVKQIFFSDEANFYLHGHINNQNYRFWAHENPHITEVKELKPQKVTVWCALSATQIFGPIFIKERITGDVYQTLLKSEFLPWCKKNNFLEDFWFMQDGAHHAHRTKPVFSLLHKTFHGRVLGLGYPSKYGCDFDWPPFSPDINPCDYFLWGFLKDQVYKQQFETIDDLKTEIQNKISIIKPTVLESVVSSFENRLDKIIEKEGSHFEKYYC